MVVNIIIVIIIVFLTIITIIPHEIWDSRSDAGEDFSIPGNNQSFAGACCLIFRVVLLDIVKMEIATISIFGACIPIYTVLYPRRLEFL